MGCVQGWRIAAPLFARCARSAAGVVGLALAAAGCASSSQVSPVADARGTTVAFESIDGLPADVVQRFARDLKDEAATRQIVVVAREADPNYRIRSYVAAGRGSPAVTWAWDVYGADQHRAFRLSGEESTGGSGGRALAAGSDPALRRIARRGMEQLAAFISAPARSEPEPARPQGGFFTVLDDFKPEAAGIFQIFQSDPVPPQPVGEALAGTPKNVPLPRRRPAAAPRPRSALAYAPAQ